MNDQQYVMGLVERARAAQVIAEKFTQDKVDLITEAIAYALTKPDIALKFGEMLVEESGMGVTKDKQAKMFSKIKGCYYQMKGKVSVGLYSSDEKMGTVTYAKPMGVIGAIIPITNGEATPVVKSLMALKTRNAIILAPHPKARETNLAVAEHMRAVLKKLQVPEDLIIPVDPDRVSVECSQEIMKQVDFILATGGTPMVRQAYSSGTPAIGVGTGNVVSIVDGTTDMNQVAELIIKSKTFDNATSCSTENNILVFESCYEDFIKAMESHGGYLIQENTPEKEKMLKTLWPETPENHNLNRHIIAQSAGEIAKIARVDMPKDIKLILVEENGGFGNAYPFTGEKLSPVSGVRKVKNIDDAIKNMQKILDYQGKGHSIGIHTSDDAKVHKLGEIAPVSKIVVNLPQSLSNSGSWTCGFPMTMTLGCGTWGSNSVSHSVTWRDLLNFTTVARPIPSYQPKDMDLFGAEVRTLMD